MMSTSAPTPTPVIELRDLSKTYITGGGETAVEALKPIDLSFARGCFTAIMGASGSGKSTLLNLLGLLDQPTTGHYFLDGENTSGLDDDTVSGIRCRKIGMVFQSFNLFSNFTVLENVCVPMRYADVGEREMVERAKRLLDQVGLADRLYHRPTQLSGGQMQRVAIARSLANEPAVILADEPTGNLDEKTGEDVLDLFHQLVAGGSTVIMVTHNPEYEHVVQRTVKLTDGRIAYDSD